MLSEVRFGAAPLAVASGFRGDDGQAGVTIGTRSRNTHWSPAEVHPWIEGSLLARRAYPWEDGDDPSDATVAVAERAITKAKKLVVIHGKPKAPAVMATVTAFDSHATSRPATSPCGPAVLSDEV